MTLPDFRLIRLLPLAVSAYARTSLTTLEHLLIPRGLKSSGLTADRALAGYGIVHGMALPVVLFPSCLLYALADLLVPELTTAQVSGRCGDIRRLVRTLLYRCLLFACGTAVLLLAFSSIRLAKDGQPSRAVHRMVRLVVFGLCAAGAMVLRLLPMVRKILSFDYAGRYSYYNFGGITLEL